VYLDDPKAPVSRALEHIADALLGPDAKPHKGKRRK
jgi:hypothetical protein